MISPLKYVGENDYRLSFIVFVWMVSFTNNPKTEKRK